MKCPVCAADVVDLYPKVRCRKCGYIESCCQPEFPCVIQGLDYVDDLIDMKPDDIVVEKMTGLNV